MINAIKANDMLVVPTRNGFSAAIVSGVAALVRAKYPKLSARQVIDLLIRTARRPAHGVDNQIGYGIVDPVAALNRDLPAAQVVSPPTKHVLNPAWLAGAGVVAAALVTGVILTGRMLVRRPKILQCSGLGPISE